MERRFQKIAPFVSLLLFVLALWVLNHELREYRYTDILAHLRGISARRILLALAATAASYGILTAYDVLAFRYIRHSLPYRRVALASFISYAFSNNVGNTLITGGSVRYRLYSSWGVSATDITKVVVFCWLTFVMGVSTVAGISLLVEPLALPFAQRLPFAADRPLGLVLLALAGTYLILSALRRKPFNIKGLEFSMPSFPLAIRQIALPSLDLATAAGVLYVLLPPDGSISYPAFLGIYVLSIVAGVISSVPGGLGVFEGLMMLFLRPHWPSDALFGSLLVYRAIYYLLPLGLATALLGGQEFLERREDVRKLAAAFRYWPPRLIPHVLAVATFVSGAILLFSGATPAAKGRLGLLHQVLPLPVLELSHFLGSLAGAALLLLARGIQRRVDAAYLLTVGLLGAGVVFSLLKGFDYEEATVLAVLLAALLPCHRQFYRRASLFSQPFSPPWIVMIAAVLLATVWLGLLSYRHVEYSSQLWWQFSLHGHAPRFLRATVGAAGVTMIFVVGRLLRPARLQPAPPGPAVIARVRTIVRQSPVTYANLALLGDKSFLFSDNGKAFIMYGVEGRSWVAMGDPIGPEDEWPELVWRFHELSDRHGGWTVFYQVSAERLDSYLDLGLTLLKLGEEGCVPLDSFSLEGGAYKSQRQILNKLEREGCVFELIPVENVPGAMPELRAVSDAWLASKNAQEKGFSLGYFKEDYLKEFPFAVVRKESRIVAFANVLSSAGKEELSVDLIRFLPEAPGGTMDHLLTRLMLWGKQEGYHWFSMGMAPLAGLENRPLAPRWNRIAGLVFRHGEHFYNFKGLRDFKDKYHPRWKPKYLASPGGLALPSVVVNVATLIGGGLKGVVHK